jgi:ubiquinone/menaquinone biosynthesis C-methylase UbiE
VKDIFSIRRSLDPPVGVPRDFLGSAVHDTHLAEIASSTLMPARIQRDTMPIPSTRDREGYYGDRHFEFWLSGMSDYLKVKESCTDIDWVGAKILDFGGATGRVARHFYAQENMGEVMVCDVNINNIDWVIENFPSGFAAFKSSPVPSLPISDNYFDLVIAFSVFTHMGEYELAWLYELRRVLKPGGVLYVSVHNDETWCMLPSTGLYSSLMTSEDFRKVYSPKSELSERHVFEYSSESAYNCHTFYPNSYIHRVWSKIFRIVHILPGHHGYQSAVVMKNEPHQSVL